jgi:DNA-directed RNA polymerase subunit beta'
VNYSDPNKLREDIHSGKIRPNDPVKFEGHDTTAGLALVNEVIPVEFRNYGGKWDKGQVSSILSKVGKAKPALYTKVADEIKELGAWYSYLLGTSFGAKDFDLDALKKSRNKSFKVIEDKMRDIDKSKDTVKGKYDKKVTLLREAQGIAAKLTAGATDNAFQQWAFSGSRGSASQVMQMIAAPTVVSDPKDRVIPFLIGKSYNEGLTPAEYWISSYGTRKGTVGAKLSVAPGGALAKELVSNVLDVVISMNDCGTKDGVELPIGDAKDIVDRFEAGTNKHIDGRYYERLLADGKKSVKVRSAITCRAKNGVCQMCFGHNEMGKLPEIGNNVGVTSAQALSEPLTQMGLSSKHTAGTAAEESVGLSTIAKFFQMPNQYVGAAVIAQNSGAITKVDPAPAGGTNVFVGVKKYHVNPGRKLIVKVGDPIIAGDLLTDGMPNIAQVVPHKGIAYSRQLFTNTAHDLYNRAGVKSIKRNFEVVARGVVNYVEVVDAGDFGDEFPLGDVVDYNEIQAEIASHPDWKAPKLKPVQRGTTYAAHEKNDWIANFGTKYLQRNLIENAALGSKADTHSYHPIPAYARAKEFGKGKDGRY